MTLRCLVVRLAVGCGLCAVPPLAHAEPASSASAAFSLAVDSDDETISFDVLVDALSSELGRAVVPVTRPAATSIRVVFRSKEHRLEVRVQRTDGRTAERTLHVRGGPDAIRREAVLLAGNMARDEAQELLDALAPAPVRRSEEPQTDSVSPPAAEEANATPPEPTTIKLPNAAPPAPAAPSRREPTWPITVGLLWPLSMNMLRPHIASHFDVSLVFGRVGQVVGAQLSSGVAFSERGGSGLQAAPGGSIATGTLRGVQMSAGVNVAQDVRGVQLGLVNVARRVRGMQVGLLNVGDNVDGAIGLISISRRSVHPAVWASNLHYANIGFRFRTRWVHTTMAFSLGSLEAPPSDGGLGWHLGIGKNLKLLGGLDVDLEVAYSTMVRSAGTSQFNSALHLAVLPGYRLASSLRIFAGGGARIPLEFQVGRSVVRPEVVAGLEF